MNEHTATRRRVRGPSYARPTSRVLDLLAELAAEAEGPPTCPTCAQPWPDLPSTIGAAAVTSDGRRWRFDLRLGRWVEDGAASQFGASA